MSKNDFKPHSEYKEITFSGKIILQTVLKPTSRLDILTPVPKQSITCDL